MAAMTEREGHRDVASESGSPSLASALGAPQDLAWADVYIHDKANEIICMKNVWLKSGVSYYEHYTWECL